MKVKLSNNQLVISPESLDENEKLQEWLDNGINFLVEDFEAARQSFAPAAEWVCACCGKPHAGNLTHCYSCNTPRSNSASGQ